MGATHQWAREVLLRAWPSVTPEPPTLPELQLVQSVAMLETHYGSGWQGPGEGSNNWGAVKCGVMPPCPPNCFENLDSDGHGGKELHCFRRYPSPEEGAANTIKLLTVKRPTVWEAMRTGDAMLTAAEMSRTRYFQADPKAYGRGLAQRSAIIASALGEPLMVHGDTPIPPNSTPSEPVTTDTSGPSVTQRIIAGAVGVALGYGMVRVLASRFPRL